MQQKVHLLRHTPVFSASMKKVLIIDDEIRIAQIIGKFLTRNGYDVTTCTGAMPAYAHLKIEKFDLVLSDFRLEDSDGREILKKVKKDYPDTGVIIISGYSDPVLAKELVDLGALTFITKPVYPHELLTTLNGVFQD